MSNYHYSDHNPTNNYSYHTTADYKDLAQTNKSDCSTFCTARWDASRSNYDSMMINFYEKGVSPKLAPPMQDPKWTKSYVM